MTKAITDESKPLTAKMQRFVEAYLANDGNGTKAAITAKYGVKSAHVTASRLPSRSLLRVSLPRMEHPIYSRNYGGD
jgi:hypothetical protein